MSGRFLVTLGDTSGLPGLFNGPFLKGQGQPRVAMVGRSNVGKSSLINALVETPLAQVSKEPGKTRAIHFYLWDETDLIVADLPGYGYARTGHSERERWSHFINAYLKTDKNLACAVVLLDARHGPTAIDCEAIEFLSLKDIPVIFVFTKSDALKTQAERAARRKEAEKALVGLGFDPKRAHWVSSRTKDGLKGLVQEFKGGRRK